MSFAGLYNYAGTKNRPQVIEVHIQCDAHCVPVSDKNKIMFIYAVIVREFNL